jgi:hypothetical protein
MGLQAQDRQFEIMAEAVMALREELARSYEHSQQLTQEVSRLRAVVASLRQELAKAKGSSGVLRDHVRALEKKLHEIEGPSSAPPSNPATAPDQPRAASKQGPGASAPAPAPAPAAPSRPAPPSADSLPADQIPDDAESE